MHETRFVIPPAQPAILAIDGTQLVFPVRRIWCVGRNYLEHVREMGQDERAPPFFFAKPADAIVAHDSVVAYPPQTADFQHEVELVVALKLGGRDIPVAAAARCIFGYAVGIDLTRRDLQLEARNLGRPWEAGKSFDDSAACGPLTRAETAGAMARGAITLRVNGRLRQSGDLGQMIWSVSEIISKLSELVSLAPGDVIMTGTPAGIGPLSPGDTVTCDIAGLNQLRITIAPAA
ncbi:fumarylacetoacetate hydrolase [Bradyrhizobium sp. NAS80.1]|uniref:fumarylacetoacetate hydrolase family protein n=1 Tax=Bradyrhizobium sp. NAS80.1 TaxID=1680159 RepID=UPI00095AA1C8|nr:fumarylacetoacetate hydrolase family protein [Bradyrhizobium sp. NAS80.1]OKO86281.1 fumarylacetoacetate hydrolase [Bradyrhizobium sp. NAS80.1]